MTLPPLCLHCVLHGKQQIVKQVIMKEEKQVLQKDKRGFCLDGLGKGIAAGSLQHLFHIHKFL